MLKVLDLFSGIGGFSLGLERTGGFQTVQFVEQATYPRAVLAKRWPEVPIHDDIRSYRAEPVDVVCGGFPCQDISLAGKGEGLAGERSGLWREMHRVIDEARPRWVIAENVSALRSRGLDEVLRSLASIGFDAEWHCVPAAALGAPHRRDRIWIVAYPDRSKCGFRTGCSVSQAGESAEPADGSDVCDTYSDSQRNLSEHAKVAWPSGHVADPNRSGRQQQRGTGPVWAQLPAPERFGWWAIEPPVGRVADGVPSRVDRLRALGNAIVPAIAEAIGQAILRREANVDTR